MSSSTATASGSSDSAPPIGSRAEFEAAVRWGVRAAIARDARRLSMLDADFAFWPLDDTALLAELTQWLHRPQRKLVLLARDYEELPRTHPRFIGWRRDWTHAIEAWALPADVQLELPTLLLDDGPVSVHLIDAVHWRGRASVDARAAHLWRENVDALLQRSESALPGHHLGL